MTDDQRPERDLDPAALDELSRAFADHLRDRQPDRLPDRSDSEADDELEPTAPTPLVSATVDTEPGGTESGGTSGTAGTTDDESLASLVTSFDDPSHESAEPTPPSLEERPIIKIGDADEAFGALEEIDDIDDIDDIDGDDADQATPEPSAPRVIAIDDADLPDAVYVQGSLDAARQRGIIIIEDDESGDALRPESERDLRRGIEPRMRERRLAVRRAQGRKRLIALGIVVGVIIVAVAALAVVGSGLFAVEEDQLVVTGNVYTDSAALQEVIDDIVGTPVLRVDTTKAEERLREISWIHDARVRTSFPHGATIEIREREALTTYQGPDGRFRVLDREGRVLDILDMYPLAYVLINGPDPVDLDVAQFAPQGYAAASELAKSLTVSVRGRVDHISVTTDGSDLKLVMNNGMEVRFGEARELITKLVRLETVLAEMRREAIEAGEDSDNLGGPDIVIDVSTSEATR
ncbi:MAG TPA: FtsQ-type POTRA domain-containing protein [Ilumatobacter sp.]|nr:FtsQ-type POTRA domain-containing protein [Ilumatobacter sp.]